MLNEQDNAGYISTSSGVELGWYGGLPTLEDIAVSLCRTPLAAGHTSDFFSLAHHSICVASGLPAPFKIYGLFHEVEVVAVGDVPGPMKTHSHRRLEKVLRNRIVTSFGIPPITDEIWEIVEAQDQINLAAVSRVFNLPGGEKIWPVSDPQEEEYIRFLCTWFPPTRQLTRPSDLSRKFIQDFNWTKGLVCAS